MDEPVKQTIDQCDNCKFMRTRTYGESAVLECRFSDPLVAGSPQGRWPQVLGDDWCGKFESVPVHAEEPIPAEA